MTSIDKVRDAATALSLRITNDKRTDFMVQCPAHDDGQASLSVSYKNDRTLMHCHAGCDTRTIVEGLGLELKDLFDEEPDKDTPMVVESYTYETASGAPWMIVDRYFPKSFRQRLPGTERGAKSGLEGRAPILYRLPQVMRGIAEGKTIWVVEGEKDVHAHEKHGNVATTMPAGAGKWRDEFSQALSKAHQVIVVADQDPPKADGSLGPGHLHAIHVRDSLRASGAHVMLVKPASGKDSHDHFAAGHTNADFRMDPVGRARPRGITHATLMDQHFPPIRWSVIDLLPSGLAILASGPKTGKSWIALDMALGVAAGGKALSSLQTTQGSVLYIAREDNDRRLQSRCDLIDPGDNAYMENIEFHSLDSDWPSGIAGMAAMTEWAEERGDPRLVVLDTLAKVEPDVESGSNRDRYRDEYALASRYKAWADRHACTVLFIHHDRKASSDNDDWTMKFSGSRGLTGAADTLLYLDCKRGEREGILHVTGRDVADDDIALRKVGPLWVATGSPGSTVGVSSEVTKDLITFVNDNPGCGLSDVYTAFPATSQAKVRSYLSRAVSGGKLVREGRGVYYPMPV